VCRPLRDFPRFFGNPLAWYRTWGIAESSVASTRRRVELRSKAVSSTRRCGPARSGGATHVSMVVAAVRELHGRRWLTDRWIAGLTSREERTTMATAAHIAWTSSRPTVASTCVRARPINRARSKVRSRSSMLDRDTAQPCSGQYQHVGGIEVTHAEAGESTRINWRHFGQARSAWADSSASQAAAAIPILRPQ
jgi:hypothetical protein